MTRDEATRLVRDGGPIGGVYKSYDEALVDSLVALGILKLDEPKIPCDRAIDLMRRKLGMSPSECSNVMILLHANGFRIVEK